MTPTTQTTRHSEQSYASAKATGMLSTLAVYAGRGCKCRDHTSYSVQMNHVCRSLDPQTAVKITRCCFKNQRPMRIVRLQHPHCVLHTARSADTAALRGCHRPSSSFKLQASLLPDSSQIMSWKPQGPGARRPAGDQDDGRGVPALTLRTSGQAGSGGERSRRNPGKNLLIFSSGTSLLRA